MTSIRAALVVGLLVTAAGACGNPSEGPVGSPAEPAAVAPTSAPAPARTRPAGSEEGRVEGAFRDYYQALLERDFATACRLSAPTMKAELLKNLRTQGGIAATSCEDALDRIYDVPAAAEAADLIATTTEVTDVTVSGDEATLTWTAEIKGGRPTVSTDLQRVDGRWLLQDTDSG